MSLLSALLLAFAFTLFPSDPAFAQRVRPDVRPDIGPRRASASDDTRGIEVRIPPSPLVDAFRSAASSAAKSTVLIRCDGKDAVLGAIVSDDGFIITKASELSGKIVCQLRGGRSYDAKLVGVVDDHDLALLKIAATGLTPVNWIKGPNASVGELLATTGTSDVPVGVGVLSVGRRRIPSRNVVLGVLLGETRSGGVPVLQVSPDTGAARAGIQVDDIILAIAGETVKSRDELIGIITAHHLGDQVEVQLRRGDERVTVKAVLGNRPTSAPSRSEVMNSLGGPLSRVNSGFAAVIQHDTVLKPEQCGGPLVDLDGKVVGINIARAGRTETYAVPADVVQSLLPDLKSGKYAATLPQVPPSRPTSRPARPRRYGPTP